MRTRRRLELTVKRDESLLTLRVLRQSWLSCVRNPLAALACLTHTTLHAALCQHLLLLTVVVVVAAGTAIFGLCCSSHDPMWLQVPGHQPFRLE
jgi:hypothetical protein